MCTVSWIRNADGYDLQFNRDERLTRTRARMPRIAELAGVRYLIDDAQTPRPALLVRDVEESLQDSFLRRAFS